MSNRQDIAFLTPFANDAETTLPGVPIGGVSYRDPSFTALGPGWPYKTKVESQDFNQVMYVQTLLMRALSNQGILDYSDKEDYVAATGAAVMDDGGVYVCLQDNGPATTVKQPSAEPTFWKRIDFTSVENRIKGQQNWNIPDPSGDPLISATPTTYSVGEFPAVNVEVVNANAVNLRRVGDLVIGDSGTLRHYARGAYRAGVIDETTEYMGIKDHLGNQLEAGVATGVTKGNNGVDLYVDVDLSQLPNGYHFAGISAERGLWVEVSDTEAVESFAYEWDSRLAFEVVADLLPGVQYLNELPYPVDIIITGSSTGDSVDIAVNVGGVEIIREIARGAAPTTTVQFSVPPGVQYRFSIATSSGATSTIIKRRQ